MPLCARPIKTYGRFENRPPCHSCESAEYASPTRCGLHSGKHQSQCTTAILAVAFCLALSAIRCPLSAVFSRNTCTLSTFPFRFNLIKHNNTLTRVAFIPPTQPSLAFRPTLFFPPCPYTLLPQLFHLINPRNLRVRSPLHIVKVQLRL